MWLNLANDLKIQNQDSRDSAERNFKLETQKGSVA